MSTYAKGTPVRLADLAKGGLFCDGDWVESKDQDPNGTIRLLQLADIGDGDFRDKSSRWLRPDQAESIGVTYVEEGDILIARMPDPLGRACIVPKLATPAITAVDVAILRIKREDVDTRWLMWWLNSPETRSIVASLASGTTRQRITRKNLEALELHLPPLEEQKRIVEALDDNLSRLDKALAEVSMAEKKTEAFIKSYLLSLVQGSASICYDSGTWQKVQIGSLGKWRGGGTPSKSNPTFWLDGQIPWLTAKDMKTFRISDTQDHITEAGVAGSSANLFPSKAVVVVTRSGILEWKLPVALTEAPVTINQDLKALVCNDDVLPEWAAYSILGFEHRILDECRKAGTTVANLNFEDFLRFEIFVPTIERQQELSKVIQESVDYLDSIRTRVKTLQTTLTDMRRSILNDAFLGALVKE